MVHEKLQRAAYKRINKNRTYNICAVLILINIYIDKLYFMYLQALNNAGFGSKPPFNCLSLQFADQLLLQFLASARFAEDFGVDMETSKTV